MKILIVSNNESIITLFDEYVALALEGKMKIVNEKPPKPLKTATEALEKIRNTDFDVLVIGHKLSEVNFELVFCGFKKTEDGEGLQVLELAKDFLKDKIVISDGCTPVNYPKVMNSYRGLGVRHFINRNTISFTERFNCLISCLNNKCNCDKL